MTTTREFRKLNFERKLDVKRLQAVLAETMRTLSEDQQSEAAPARLESVFIGPDRTTVFLSGTGATVEALAKAVCVNHKDAKVEETTREEARRPPKEASAS